jgi:hypothetical protein
LFETIPHLKAAYLITADGWVALPRRILETTAFWNVLVANGVLAVQSRRQ